MQKIREKWRFLRAWNEIGRCLFPHNRLLGSYLFCYSRKKEDQRQSGPEDYARWGTALLYMYNKLYSCTQTQNHKHHAHKRTRVFCSCRVAFFWKRFLFSYLLFSKVKSTCLLLSDNLLSLYSCIVAQLSIYNTSFVGLSLIQSFSHDPLNHCQIYYSALIIKIHKVLNK